jgi:hypothetical protein
VERGRLATLLPEAVVYLERFRERLDRALILPAIEPDEPDAVENGAGLRFPAAALSQRRSARAQPRRQSSRAASRSSATTLRARASTSKVDTTRAPV